MTPPRDVDPSSPTGPCWTGAVAPVICSRGGIGCPLPHDGGPVPTPMPAEFIAATPTCPEHHQYGYNGRLYCSRCADEGRDRWGAPWKREWRRVRRAKRRAWKRWRRELRAMRDG